MIKALFKFAKIPELIEGKPPVVIDTTSNTHPDYAHLSPFVLPAPPAKNFENLWQFSKVYFPEHVDSDGSPNHEWYEWQRRGFADFRAHRYPMGKGRIPRYSMWNGEKLGYIEARKGIYAPIYAENVSKSRAYKLLELQYRDCLKENKELVLLDYDAYDHTSMDMSLIDVINNPKRKMGHAFVLIMMLVGMLEECINSSSELYRIKGD